MPGLSSLILASTLALHPFSPPMAVRAPEPEPDPSWNEPDEPATEPTEGTPTEGTPTEGTPTEGTESTPTEGDPAAVGTTPPPVVPVPVPMVMTRPAPPSGLGLMIGAGVTGGLAWLTVFARLRSIKNCNSAIGESVLGSGGLFDAVGACLKSGVAIGTLTPLGWILNDVTYGLAPAAGVYRGKYDGVRAAWDGGPKRNEKLFIGLGAGLLGAGVVGRVTTFVVFFRQLNPSRLFANYPLTAHFFLAQLSSASIQAGSGLLGYGLAYKKMRTNEEGRRKAAGLADVKLSPQLGWAYSGLALTGKF